MVPNLEIPTRFGRFGDRKYICIPLDGKQLLIDTSAKLNS